MKKLVGLIIALIVLVIATYLVINSNIDVQKVLAKYETCESDGFYDNKNNVEASGYIVSNKTSEGFRYGYVNYKGKILLDTEYNEIYRILDIEDKDKVYLIDVKDGRYGVSLNGKDIIKNEYQFIEYNSNVKDFVLQKNSSYGVANIKGKIIIPVQNELVEVKGKYIYVSNGDNEKVYDEKGKETQIDFSTSINPTENENYFIKILENEDIYFYGIVDKNGKELVPSNYTYIEYLFDNYFIAANKDGKEGIIDQNNNIKLEFNYTSVQQIQNTTLIRTLDKQTNQTDIYTKDLNKIITLENANIEKDGNTIKIYNSQEEKYFDINGIEINK